MWAGKDRHHKHGSKSRPLGLNTRAKSKHISPLICFQAYLSSWSSRLALHSKHKRWSLNGTNNFAETKRVKLYFWLHLGIHILASSPDRVILNHVSVSAVFKDWEEVARVSMTVIWFQKEKKLLDFWRASHFVWYPAIRASFNGDYIIDTKRNMFMTVQQLHLYNYVNVTFS